MTPINLNQIPTEYIMKTKAGKLWRCGRGYRKNWSMLIGKLVLLHNTPYTLINRVKEAGKWYLVFTDGTSNYTERQDKALHNKKLAKDTIIEVAKRVIAGLLPAPMELVDRLVQEMQIRSKEYNKLFKEKYGKRKKKGLLPLAPQCNDFDCKIMYLSLSNVISKNLYNSYYKQLVHYYHPDKGNVQNMDYINDILFLYK